MARSGFSGSRIVGKGDTFSTVGGALTVWRRKKK